MEILIHEGIVSSPFECVGEIIKNLEIFDGVSMTSLSEIWRSVTNLESRLSLFSSLVVDDKGGEEREPGFEVGPLPRPENNVKWLNLRLCGVSEPAIITFQLFSHSSYKFIPGKFSDTLFPCQRNIAKSSKQCD